MINKKTINKCIKILDIAEEFGIPVEEYGTGNFTHRCKCPNVSHKSGSERTGSLYIDERGNNFYCFGCGESSWAIDFYMLCKNCNFQTALYELANKVPKDFKIESSIIENDNYEILLEISDVMRNYIVDRIDDYEFYIKFCEFVDGKINNINKYDTGRSLKLLNSVKACLSKRRRL